MTNFERIKLCKTPEELAYIYYNLQQNAIYANGRLLDTNNPDDFMIWLQKESNSTDTNTTFNTIVRKCPYCEETPELVTYGDDNNLYHYQCSNCGFSATNIASDVIKTPVRALVKWNY